MRVGAGHIVAIQESAAPLCDRQGQVIGAVVVFHDVTRERRLKRALAWQASHDALTGLINRREFDNRLHAALLSAQRGEGSYALRSEEHTSELQSPKDIVCRLLLEKKIEDVIALQCIADYALLPKHHLQ